MYLYYSLLDISFQGENGVLELFIEGDFADTFEVSPSVVENSAQFVVSVKSSKKIDYEEVQKIEFKVMFARHSIPNFIYFPNLPKWPKIYIHCHKCNLQIVAREVGSSDQLQSSALVTVNILDRNDNVPVFEREKYEVDVRENEENGKVILKVGLRKNSHWVEESAGKYLWIIRL